MATITSGTVLLEARPYRPFKSSEEYLYAMREDLAEWLNILYPDLMINVDNFMDRLDTGVALCKHANNVRVAAEEYITRRQARNKSMTRSMTSGLAGPILAMGNVHYLPAAKSGTFFSRDNVSNFIAWCRKSLQIFECLLFETDDLIMRKNEKHVILCLLEVARRGAKFGMLAPMLVQMERQIDREIAADNKLNASQYDCCSTQTDSSCITDQTISISNENDEYESDSEDEDNQDDGPMLVYGPQPQIITNDLKSLDEMVRDLVEKCTCPSQFPMVRVSEGKYRIGDTKVLIFVRILRSHVMVRVGGGWDTLSHYLDKHDPCRCRAQHRTSVAARLITRTNTTTNGIELHKAQVFYDRSPPSTRKQSLGAVSPSTVTTTPVYATLSPSTKSALRSRSPTPQGKRVNYAIGDNLQTTEKLSMLQSPNLARRSISPSPRRLIDYKNKKQNSLDSNSSNASHKNDNPAQALANIQAIAAVQLETLNDMKNDTIEGSNKFENVSDNGSEISDEGYRSLGLIQTNGNNPSKRISLHSQVSNEDAEINGRLDQTSSESPMSSNDETISKQSEDVTDGTTTPKESDEPRNNFEKSGIFITDDDITVDIANNTGLRKTGFSNNLYSDDIPIISSNNKKVMSKIPRSPMPIRRKSIDNSNVTNQTITTGLPIMSRKMPAYRSVRKLNTTTTPESNVTTPTNNNNSVNNNNNNNHNGKIPNVTGKETSTWSGRTNTKKRPTLNSETFSSPQMTRNTAQRASQTKYDKNGRRIKSTSQNSSVSTSPVKTSTSPLAQQILEVAGTARNDKQIIDKMRELLNRYSKTDPTKIIASGITGNNVSIDATIQNKDDYDDFTTAWVNSNGAINLGKTTTATVANKKLLNKRSSTISSSSSTHSNGKESLSGLSCNNLNITASPKRERSNLGSKIPSRVQRNNTELY